MAGHVRIKDVAEAAGVSPPLVSFALNDRAGVLPARKARIIAVAAELGYSGTPPPARCGRGGPAPTGW